MRARIQKRSEEDFATATIVIPELPALVLTPREAKIIARDLARLAKWALRKGSELQNENPRANPPGRAAVEVPEECSAEEAADSQSRRELMQTYADGWNQGVRIGQHAIWHYDPKRLERSRTVSVISQARVTQRAGAWRAVVTVTNNEGAGMYEADLQGLELIDPELRGHPHAAAIQRTRGYVATFNESNKSGRLLYIWDGSDPARPQSLCPPGAYFEIAHPAVVTMGEQGEPLPRVIVRALVGGREYSMDPHYLAAVGEQH
ncbi:MAG: hypothetical protein IPK75_20425 [Acidobacteria bacterium]|nr:hypothetical protein [Acidobacteriota bacterium]